MIFMISFQNCTNLKKYIEPLASSQNINPQSFSYFWNIGLKKLEDFHLAMGFCKVGIGTGLDIGMMV